MIRLRVRESVFLMARDVRHRMHDDGGHGVTGQLAAGTPFVLEDLRVDETLRVIGPDVDAVQVQAFHHLWQIFGTGQCLADGLVDKPFKCRDAVGGFPPDRGAYTFVAVHRWGPCDGWDE